MRLCYLTNEQKELIFKKEPVWMLDHDFEWIASHHPNYGISHKPELMCCECSPR